MLKGFNFIRISTTFSELSEKYFCNFTVIIECHFNLAFIELPVVYGFKIFIVIIIIDVHLFYLQYLSVDKSGFVTKVDFKCFLFFYCSIEILILNAYFEMLNINI